MNKEELEEIKRVIKRNADYKEHLNVVSFFEVKHIDNLVKCYEKQKRELKKKDKIIDDAAELINHYFYEKEPEEDIFSLHEEMIGILERSKNVNSK